ncbi:MAG: oligopeptide/dipeptide ABC transporter ATP-binding protein [Rhodospirillales bacterium]|jgi:ABC-type oligopeptide transport system ATPase subunit
MLDNSSDQQPIIEAKDLTTRFDIKSGMFGKVTGRVHAVEGVNFHVNPKETLSLVGESGCGKSTTGRSLLKLVEPTRGKVIFEGEDITDFSATQMRAIRPQLQMIFQDPFASLNPRLTAGAAIAEPMKVHGIASGSELKDRVASLLRRVGLPPEYAQRFPHEFSGGQRQRICIARALGLNPRMIVADEAVSALDVTIKAQVINLMMELQDEFDIAFLFISHDMAVVERISHRVAVMYLGQIVELGTRQAVFENPTHPYTKKLLAAVPVADPRERNLNRALNADEIPSPVKPVGFEPNLVKMEEIAPGHFVLPH